MNIFRRYRRIRAGLVRATAAAIVRCVRQAQKLADNEKPCIISARLTLGGPMHFFIPRRYYFHVTNRVTQARTTRKEVDDLVGKLSDLIAPNGPTGGFGSVYDDAHVPPHIRGSVFSMACGIMCMLANKEALNATYDPAVVARELLEHLEDGIARLPQKPNTSP